jgi:lipopolysaccharide export system permease protein
MTRRMDAKKGKYKNGAWRLENVTEQDLSRGQHEVTHKDTAVVPMEFSMKDLDEAVTASEEMTSAQLSEYAQKASQEGYDPTPYRVDLAAKTAFPFVCLILAVLGGAMALRSKRGEGLAKNVVLGIVLAFGYWVAHSLCLSLGYAGLYPPFAAAWTANTLFGALATLMVLGLE